MPVYTPRKVVNTYTVKYELPSQGLTQEGKAQFFLYFERTLPSFMGYGTKQRHMEAALNTTSRQFGTELEVKQFVRALNAAGFVNVTVD